jgi:hypothetical protein
MLKEIVSCDFEVYFLGLIDRSYVAIPSGACLLAFKISFSFRIFLYSRLCIA